ncbi:hypothetical protein L1049_007399 [Liquidambar formosana]|uniref:Uncharacterized protein n=1 Tax=Liquidambar formosana TaxID=63359 RepID=A0AAP0N799_LIQFO
MATESSSTMDQKSRGSRGKTEPKKKMKKLRSIKLSRLPSSKPSTRRAKTQSDQHAIESFRDAATSQKPSPIEFSDAYPGCFNGRKKNFQASPHTSEFSFGSNGSIGSRPEPAPPRHKSARILTRTCSLKPMRKLTRVSSLKSKRNKMKNSRLKQPTVLSKPNFDKLCVDLSSNASTPHKLSATSTSEMSPNYLKATSCSDLRKVHFQVSPPNSESGSNGEDQRRKNSNISKPSSASPSLKSARTLMRKTSMKPVRILTKMASLKSKRLPVTKCSEVSRTPDVSVSRATCSSSLKNSKIPHHVDLEPGESNSEGLSAMKVCPYTYCSLHNHRHAPMPPLKRFLSMRRRSLRTQKSIKRKSLTPLRANHSRDVKKGIQENRMVSIGNTVIPETARSCKAISPVIEDLGMDFFIEIYGKQRPVTWRRHSWWRQ